jgi:DNA primase
VKGEELSQAGLATPRQEGGGYYDRFRGRLIFPIRDLRGRVIAFGGRALGSEDPKYLNSPETPLYVKGQTLFALDLAKHSIRERERALIVEGYIDCLMAHQHGFTETVAPLGTAFTGAQLQLLHRYTDEVVTFFDADAAGEKAAQRAEELLEPTEAGLVWAVNRSGHFEGSGSLRLRVALLPSGEDPDTFLRKEGAEAFRERIVNARSILSYSIEKALSEEEMKSARGRATAAARVALILSKVQDAQEASELAREAALRLGVDQTQLWIEARELQARKRSALKAQPRTPDTGPRAPNPPATERDLVLLLVQSEEARRTLLPFLELEDLTHPLLRGILEGLKKWPGVRPDQLMGQLGDAEQGQLAALLLEEKINGEVQAIREFKRRAEIRRRASQIRRMTQAILEAQMKGDPKVDALKHELEALQRQAQELRGIASPRPVPRPAQGNIG